MSASSTLQECFMPQHSCSDVSNVRPHLSSPTCVCADIQENACIFGDNHPWLPDKWLAWHAGDLQTLDAFFKTQSIGAHRPPHIPALRMLPNVASAEAAGLLGTAGQLRSQLRVSFK